MYDFYLGTELSDQGAKFDDLNFKYRGRMNKAPSINYVTLEGGGEGVETSVTDCYRGEGGVEPPVTLH